jgi:hypothetical protein
MPVPQVFGTFVPLKNFSGKMMVQCSQGRHVANLQTDGSKHKRQTET